MTKNADVTFCRLQNMIEFLYANLELLGQDP